MKAPGDISIHLRPTSEPDNRMLVSSLHGGNNMLTKYALVAIIALCLTALGFTLMVRDSLCELNIRDRGMEFKAVLAYESRK